MFKFQNPNLSSEVKDNIKKVTLNLEAGEELNEVSDVDSIQSFTDDDVLDLDHEKRIRAKVGTYHVLELLENIIREKFYAMQK